jgi:uncharacterized protein (DUF433 family)
MALKRNKEESIMQNATNGNSYTNGQSVIVRTSRGLTIGGTRLTLYSIMDHLRAGQPLAYIRELFSLTEQQMAEVLAYLEAHQAEVEAEYQEIVAESARQQKEWESRRREIHARIAQAHSGSAPEAALRHKLAEEKARLGME